MNNQDVSVLVVDDESLIVDQLVFYLEDLGFTVCGYKNPVEAVEEIKKNIYDVVMTDLKMPQISGMDIVKTIKEKGDDTKIIIFTGFATAESAIDAIKLGVYSYIRKPYSLNEIRDTVTNAARQLFLQRENIALNLKIQKMFNYLTTLYDIISILYQVQDFDMALEMVLDTLSEGIKAHKAGIFLKPDNSEWYIQYKSVGINEEFVNGFKYRENSLINGESVTMNKSVVLTEISGHIEVDNVKLNNDPDIHQLLLIPIRYQEKLLGHIAVYDMDEEFFSLEDYIQLLEVLAIQIAPVLNAMDESSKSADEHTIDQIVEKILADKISYADKTRSNVSIGLLHLVFMKSEEQLDSAEIVKKTFQEIIQRRFSQDGDIIWQSFNSVLLVRPGEDQVSLDMECSQVKSELEHHFADTNGVAKVSMEYGIVVYPFDGKSANEILDRLNTQLFT